MKTLLPLLCDVAAAAFWPFNWLAVVDPRLGKTIPPAFLVASL